jgi:hypothetical protein
MATSPNPTYEFGPFSLDVGEQRLLSRSRALPLPGSFIPDAGPEQMEWFNDLQRISASPENPARLMEEFSQVDVSRLLADIHVPTIVFHC